MKKIPVARDCMATTLVTLRKGQSIFEAIDTLLKSRISGAPVIDEQNHLLGVLSEKDCLRVIANGAFYKNAGGIVEDYMSTTLVTVAPGDDLFRLAEVFLAHHIRRLPVVENGLLIGQVSRRDILQAARRVLEESPIEKPWTDSKFISDEMKARLADPPRPTDP